VRRTYVIEDDCRWEESVSPCTCVFYTTDDSFLFFFFFLDKRFSGSAHALKCLLLAEERYLYLDKQYLVDRHVPWFQTQVYRSRYNPTLIRQICTSKYSFANLKTDIFLFYFHISNIISELSSDAFQSDLEMDPNIIKLWHW